MAQDSLLVQKKDTIPLVKQEIKTIIPPDTIPINDSLNYAASDTSLVSVKTNYFAIYISADYGKLITTLAQLENKYEFNLGIQFSKHLRFTADFGYGNLSPPNAIENGTYNSSGNYYRAGLDFMLVIAPKISLSFGGMYALSTFNDEGTVEIKSEVWPSLNQSFARADFTASWAEFVITSEAPVLNRNEGFFSNFYWGIKFRFRFMIDRPRPENFDVYAIPGYGRTFNNLVPAANLFISYKF